MPAAMTEGNEGCKHKFLAMQRKRRKQEHLHVAAFRDAGLHPVMMLMYVIEDLKKTMQDRVRKA